MTTYYVSSVTGSDSSSGTSTAAPFATLQAAADATKAGDTVEVMNGTYSDPGGGDWGVLTITTSGTSTAPITFEAMPGQTPVIDSSGNWAGVAVVGASYIDIKGFTIVGDSQRVTAAYARSQEANLNNPVTAGDGIDVEQASSSGRIPSHVTIEDNIVRYEPGAGINAMNGDYIAVLNNTAFNNAYWSPYAESGISVGFLKAVDSTTGVHNTIIGNTVYGNQEYIPNYTSGTVTDGNGIILDSISSTGDAAQTLVQNNLSYANGGSGIQVFRSNNVQITGNTAYLNVRTPGLKDGQIDSQQSKNVIITNNITTTSAPQLTTVAPLVVEGGQTTEIATVLPVLKGDALELQNVTILNGGTLSLKLVNGVEVVLFTAQSTVAVSGTSSVSFQLKDTTASSIVSGSASIMLDAGPHIMSVTPKFISQSQTTVIGTVTPGRAGDILTLTETDTTKGGTLALTLVGGSEQIVYKAPLSVSSAGTDTVNYSVKDQHNGVVATATASISLQAPPAQPLADLTAVSAKPATAVTNAFVSGGDTVWAGSALMRRTPTFLNSHGTNVAGGGAGMVHAQTIGRPPGDIIAVVKGSAGGLEIINNFQTSIHRLDLIGHVPKGAAAAVASQRLDKAGGTLFSLPGGYEHPSYGIEHVAKAILGQSADWR
jgi:hypothetical protein